MLGRSQGHSDEETNCPIPPQDIHGRIKRGGGGGLIGGPTPSPDEIHKIIGFLSNTGPVP